MRAAFIGTNALSLTTGELLLTGGHEVIFIERDRERIATLAEELDCGFLHGDGTEPAVLRDAQPESTDVLFCLLGSDQTNIIASLVGRSLGFKRVFTRIDKAEFQEICNELGLEDAVLTNRAVALHLLDALREETSLEMSTLIRDDAAVFRFVATEADAVPVAEMGLPRDARIVCLYRNDRFTLPEQIHSLEPGDEVILIAGRKRLNAWTRSGSAGHRRSTRRSECPGTEPEPTGSNSAPTSPTLCVSTGCSADRAGFRPKSPPVGVDPPRPVP